MPRLWRREHDAERLRCGRAGTTGVNCDSAPPTDGGPTAKHQHAVGPPGTSITSPPRSMAARRIRPTSSRCAVRTTERRQHGSTARSGALGGPESFCLKLGQRPCATHRYMRPPAFLAARAGQRATVAVEYRERGSAPGLPRGTARVPVHERGWSADGLPADDPHVVRGLESAPARSSGRTAARSGRRSRAASPRRTGRRVTTSGPPSHRHRCRSARPSCRPV